MGLNVGDTVPEFTLNDQNGQPFSSSSLLGKKPMVIYFYPKDDTPGCTKEACSFRDSYEDFKDLGAEVIGISGDTVKSHSKFAKKHQLPFILLSDGNNEVRKAFKVGKSMLILPGRETYVIDRNGKIIMVFNNLLNAEKHITEAINALKKSQQ